MDRCIEAENLSLAWARALGATLDAGGKAVNLTTRWRGMDEDFAVREAIDQFLAQRRSEQQVACSNAGWTVWSVETVANTIFPIDLYMPAHGDHAMEVFTELYLEGREFMRSARPEGEYCERLVAWPGPAGATVNQLEVLAHKLRCVRSRGVRGSLSSDYEIAVAHPEDAYDLRIQTPGLDTRRLGFPCLSHVSITLHDGELHLTAMYRNQHLVRKAYGNYLGLTRLGYALAHEAGMPLGEVMVIATHADAEVRNRRGFGETRLRELAAMGAQR